MKHRGILIIALLLAGAAAWAMFAPKKGGAGKGQPEMQAVKVERGDLQVTVVSTGVVQPQNRLEIKPPIAGRVEEVLVREGDQLKKGQVLAWMSSTERAALLDAAQAQGPESVKKWEQVYRPAPLLAPLDGTLIQRAVEPGQTVTATDAVLILSDRLIVKAQVDETDVGQVRLGQEAAVVLDSYPGQEIPAKVDHIAYEAKTVNNVTIYEVDVLPQSVPDFMRSGMTATVTFRVESREGTLLVPAAAVAGEKGRRTVQASARPGGRPSVRNVETGLSDGRNTEILSGLEEGETVWVKGMGRLPPKKQQFSPFSPVPTPRDRDSRRP